jgi:hypothetical protein
MSEYKSSSNSADQKPDALFARIGDGSWFAIPPSMADSFRCAGAEVKPAHEITPSRENMPANSDDINRIGEIASLVRRAIESCSASELPWRTFPKGPAATPA